MSQLVVPLEFAKEVLVPKRVRQHLKHLSLTERRDLTEKLKEICRKGPGGIRKLDFYHRGEARAIAGFIVGKVLGIIEVLRKHIRLVEVIHLERLALRNENRNKLIWKRCQERHYRIRNSSSRRGYKIETAILIDEANSFVWYEKLEMAYRDISKRPRVKVLRCLSWTPWSKFIPTAHFTAVWRAQAQPAT